MQLLFDFKALQAVTTQAVNGEMPAADALAKMLSGTGLTFKFTNEETVSITSAATAAAASADVAAGAGEVHLARTDRSSRSEGRARVIGMRTKKPCCSRSQRHTRDPGQRIEGFPLNADIRRDENDIQPYIIFGSKQIERSGGNHPGGVPEGVADTCDESEFLLTDYSVATTGNSIVDRSCVASATMRR